MHGLCDNQQAITIAILIILSLCIAGCYKLCITSTSIMLTRYTHAQGPRAHGVVVFSLMRSLELHRRRERRKSLTPPLISDP